MHAIYLLIIFAVTVLTTFSISMNMATISGTPAMYRAPTSYTRGVTTTSAHSDETDRTTTHAIGLQHLMCSVCPHLLLRLLPLIGTMVVGTVSG